jgi:hypothetical protein
MDPEVEWVPVRAWAYGSPVWKWLPKQERKYFSQLEQALSPEKAWMSIQECHLVRVPVPRLELGSEQGREAVQVRWPVSPWPVEWMQVEPGRPEEPA